MPEAQPSPVEAMFGRIAGVYDFLNHFLSLGIDRYWRRELAKLLKPGSLNRTADLAAGTLDVSLALLKRQPDLTIPAIDFCRPMLVRGRAKLDAKSSGHIFPCEGDALRLPLSDNSVDNVTMAFGIRNITPRMAAFHEMLRVLAPGGRACILEFGSGKEKIWGGIYNIYLDYILPVLGRLAARDRNAYSYLANTIREFPAASALASEMREAGFANTHWRKLTSGIVCLHWGEKPLSSAS